MPHRSRSNSPLSKNSKHKRARSSSPSRSSSSSSRSPTRHKRNRSASPDVKAGSHAKAKPQSRTTRGEGGKSDKKGKASRSGSPKREKRTRSRSREGVKKEKRNGEQNESRIKREARSDRPKVKSELSPLAPGGRRWDDDSVKKENELRGWGADDKDQSSAKKVEKLKPDFSTSGILEEERHTVNGINLNYSEPPDARTPDAKWRLYVFKGEKQLEPLAIHRQSAYIVGRERKVAHLPIDHPSCSKLHSVIQFRIKRITPATADEEAVTAIRPYIIDLNSTNGTMLNGKKIDPAKYYELLEEDVLKFGHSTREYVLIKAEVQAGPTTLD